jgi:hypothetical protein
MEFILQEGGKISVEGFKSTSPTSSCTTHVYVEYVHHVIHVTGFVRLDALMRFRENDRRKLPDIKSPQDWFPHHDKVPAGTDLFL